MNKIFLILGGFLISIATSCKKNDVMSSNLTPVNKDLTNGFPDNPSKINGYLYADIQTNAYNSSSSNISNFLFAAFSDPAKKLTSAYNHYQSSGSFSSLGNIDVGSVALNGYSLFKNVQQNFSVWYSSSYSLTYSSANWVTNGNGVFKPMNVNLNRGFPVINASLIPVNYSISKNSDYTINIGNNVSNYDSLIVIFSDGSFSSIGNIKKTLPANSTSVTFKYQELSLLYSTSSARISIYAFNYSNNTVNDKVNLFELGNKLIFNGINLY